jgi:small-conductance mechanosensitive channel
LYLVFKIIVEEIGVKNIRDPKARYSFRKTGSILFILFVLGASTAIWIENTTGIILIYSLIATGLVFTSQDIIKNFVGGATIFVTGIYRVGDRVEINSKVGDVIDITLMHTILLELRGRISGDLSTGRLVIIPNANILSKPIYNYTKDHNFIWNEFVIPISYDSDLQEATEIIMDLVKRKTSAVIKRAKKDITQFSEKYHITTKQLEPKIYIHLTENYIDLHVRHILEVREKKDSPLLLNTRLILEAIQNSKNVKIGGSRLEISAFPELNINT